MASSFQKQVQGLAAGAAPTGPIAPERQPVRPEPSREEDPRERAAKRAAQIRGHLVDLDEGTDRFYIPPEIIPDGWSYEWKVQTVLNAENPAHMVELERKGWTPVPLDRNDGHRAMMPMGWKGNTITRDGMILMERPQEITDEAIAIRNQRARAQVRSKEAQLAAAPPGQFERTNKDASLVRVKKSYSPVEIPQE